MGKDHGPGSMEEAFKAAREAGARVLADHRPNHPAYDFNLEAGSPEELRAVMEFHLGQVYKLTEQAWTNPGDPKWARVLAELSRSNATAAMACAVALTGTPLTDISIDGTGQ